MVTGSNDFYDELDFKKMIDLERKRSQRSLKPFILILIDIKSLIKPCSLEGPNIFLKAFASSFRETDFRGWYMRESIVGIAFTELNSVGRDTRAILFGKLETALTSQMDPDDLQKIYVTFHTYPSSHDDAVSCGRFDLERCQDLAEHHVRMQAPPVRKRLMEVMGSFSEFVRLVPAFFSHPTSKM